MLLFLSLLLLAAAVHPTTAPTTAPATTLMAPTYPAATVAPATTMVDDLQSSEESAFVSEEVDRIVLQVGCRVAMRAAPALRCCCQLTPHSRCPADDRAVPEGETI